jgi:hypothetical protein
VGQGDLALDIDDILGVVFSIGAITYGRQA